MIASAVLHSAGARWVARITSVPGAWPMLDGFVIITALLVIALRDPVGRQQVFKLPYGKFNFLLY